MFGMKGMMDARTADREGARTEEGDNNRRRAHREPLEGRAKGEDGRTGTKACRCILVAGFGQIRRSIGGNSTSRRCAGRLKLDRIAVT